MPSIPRNCRRCIKCQSLSLMLTSFLTTPHFVNVLGFTAPPRTVDFISPSDLKTQQIILSAWPARVHLYSSHFTTILVGRAFHSITTAKLTLTLSAGTVCLITCLTSTDFSVLQWFLGGFWLLLNVTQCSLSYFLARTTKIHSINWLEPVKGWRERGKRKYIL
jgi:hypothetical protein